MRRNYAIDRMVAERKVTAVEGEAAKKRPVVLAPKNRPDELAPYFVEELRRYLENKYGTSAVHEGGLKVYSTLNVEMQRAANAALVQGLRAFDKRQGWRGAERNLLAQRVVDLNTIELDDWKLPIRTNDVVPGIVLDVNARNATIRIGEYKAQLAVQDIGWTRARTPAEILRRGDVALFMVRSMNSADRKVEVTLEQRPKVQGALVAIDPLNGEVKAMVGGYDFDDSKFNRATQALRQTGSAFKPFIYAAAVDKGLRPDDTVLDAPVNFGSYSPGNYDGRFEGTITIRRAIAQSRNIPAVKTLASIGIPAAIPYIKRFGITSKIEPYLPIALGATDVTLIEMTSAYSVFPNDGVRVVPRLIRRVANYDDDILEEELPELRDAIPAATARIMVDLLQEPVRSGTATAARQLMRPVAGKTGTTNDFTDAWFMGFTASLTAGVWVGFDEKVPLGDGETGGVAALPIWLDFIREVYKDKPAEPFPFLKPGSPALTTAAPRLSIEVETEIVSTTRQSQ